MKEYPLNNIYRLINKNEKGEIRTYEQFNLSNDFELFALNHSATFPTNKFNKYITKLTFFLNHYLSLLSLLLITFTNELIVKIYFIKKDLSGGL